jgi:hypothetical protein
MIVFLKVKEIDFFYLTKPYGFMEINNTSERASAIYCYNPSSQ